MFWQQLVPKPGATADQVDRLANDFSIFRLPQATMYLVSILQILAEDMGFRGSIEAGRGQFADGKLAPWMSYSLLEYLMGLDLREFDLLEIGGGDSTPFWAARTRSVTTLEANPQYVEQIKRDNPGVKVEFAAADDLGPRVAAFERKFDIIVIDPAANRVRCARAAINKVADGGFVILDNSDWYPNASRILREGGLIQIDFHDFRPLHFYRATTSIFLTPGFRPKPLENRLPLSPIGGKVVTESLWDQE